MKQKEYTVIGAIIVGAFVVGYFFNSGSSQTVRFDTEQVAKEERESPSELKDVDAADVSEVLAIKEDDHVRGDRNADIFVIEYSDYQCPFCARAHQTIIDLLERRPNTAWVYRNLIQINSQSYHPLATITTYAAECLAEEKGNEVFWRFSDDLFLRDEFNLFGRGQTEQGIVDAIGKKYGASSLESCIRRRDIQEKVETEVRDGAYIGASGTPAFFIVNFKKGEYKMVSGSLPLSHFLSAVDELSQ